MLSLTPANLPLIYKVPAPQVPGTPVRADPEVGSLARQIAQGARAGVARYACMVFTQQRFGHDLRAWAENLREFMHIMFVECQQAWLQNRGITEAEVLAAVASLEQAETIIAYIDSLPD